MPLSKSMSQSDIIRTEMKHGKPQKQAIAISYRVKGERPSKRAAAKRKKSKRSKRR